MVSMEDKQNRPKRWSAKRKVEVVLRILRGESLDALSRETGQSAHQLSQWRDEFLASGEFGLKSRRDDPETDLHLEEKRRLQAKLGETLMENELLREKIGRLEGGRPLGWRRSKP